MKENLHASLWFFTCLRILPVRTLSKINVVMVTFTQTFRIYETLNKYFRNEDDAKSLASGIEEMVNYRFQTEKERLATKMDVMELKGDISQLKVRMRMAFRDQLKWLITVLAAFAVLMIVAIRLMVR
jgi:hypothetical protein